MIERGIDHEQIRDRMMAEFQCLLLLFRRVLLLLARGFALVVRQGKLGDLLYFVFVGVALLSVILK